ncbi:MAG: HIT domain-containing protein [Sneathiella sp.]
MFKLHPRLEADTLPIIKLQISSLYLMKDARFPWVILVPERDNLTELHHLSEKDYAIVTQEMHQIAQMMEDSFSPDKINVGALGNLVPQLHIHIIARFTSDDAWPAPVWGAGDVQPYTASAESDMITKLQKSINSH